MNFVLSGFKVKTVRESSKTIFNLNADRPKEKY
jgi:hypothetical protein